MASVGEGDCHKDPNFAVICSFFDKFSEPLGLPHVTYTDLQRYLEDTSNDVSKILIDIHVRLLRRIGKTSVTSERFEKSIVKFLHHFSEFDAWEVESYGYKHAKLATKLRILKNLMECQFDFNLKFKEKVNESSAEDMRLLPIGRDKEGQAYWYLLDKEMNFLVYREEQDDEAADTWQLVCSDRQELARLVNSLQSEANKTVKEEEDKASTNSSRSSKESTPEKVIIKEESVEVKLEKKSKKKLGDPLKQEVKSEDEPETDQVQNVNRHVESEEKLAGQKEGTGTLETKPTQVTLSHSGGGKMAGEEIPETSESNSKGNQVMKVQTSADNLKKTQVTTESTTRIDSEISPESTTSKTDSEVTTGETLKTDPCITTESITNKTDSEVTTGDTIKTDSEVTTGETVKVDSCITTESITNKTDSCITTDSTIQNTIDSEIPKTDSGVTTGETVKADPCVTTENITSKTDSVVTTGDTIKTDSEVTTGETVKVDSCITTESITNKTDSFITTDSTIQNTIDSEIPKTDSGVTTGETIKADSCVTTDETIKADSCVTTGETIKADSGVTTGETIKADSCVTTGETIKADSGVTTGETIKADSGVTTGETIKTDSGVTTGYTIKADSVVTTGETIKTDSGVTTGETIKTDSGVTTGETIKTDSGVTTGETIKADSCVTSGETTKPDVEVVSVESLTNVTEATKSPSDTDSKESTQAVLVCAKDPPDKGTTKFNEEDDPHFLLNKDSSEKGHQAHDINGDIKEDENLSAGRGSQETCAEKTKHPCNGKQMPNVVDSSSTRELCCVELEIKAKEGETKEANENLLEKPKTNQVNEVDSEPVCEQSHEISESCTNSQSKKTQVKLDVASKEKMDVASIPVDHLVRTSKDLTNITGCKNESPPEPYDTSTKEENGEGSQLTSHKGADEKSVDNGLSVECEEASKLQGEDPKVALEVPDTRVLSVDEPLAKPTAQPEEEKYQTTESHPEGKLAGTICSNEEIDNVCSDEKMNNAAVSGERKISENAEHSPGHESQRKLKRSAPEPGSDESVQSEPNGKRAKQATKNQKTRGGRNAAAKRRAKQLVNKDSDSDDSETPLSQVRSRVRNLKGKSSKTEQESKSGAENDEDVSDPANGKRAKKKKPGSSSEALSDDEVTPAKKGRKLTQASAKAKPGKTKGKAGNKTPAAPGEDDNSGIRRSLRVRQLKAKRPPTPSSPSEESEAETEDEDPDRHFLDVSFTPEEESGDEEFKPKGRNFQRQAARSCKENDEDFVNDDTPCVKCGKYNHPEMILLCDKCDAGYHTACLRPPLMLIPDGDWFCPPCEHSMLVSKLLECLQALDNAKKKKDRLNKRQERLAFVGINISNILQSDRKDGRSERLSKTEDELSAVKKKKMAEVESGSSTSEEEEPKVVYKSERLALRQAQNRSKREKHKLRRAKLRESPEMEVLSKRTCRLRNAVSYQFKEFDELISSAIADDKPCRREKPPGISRGKDMSNILGASDEEDEKIRQRDGESGHPPPVLKKRSKRKLTKLDSDEEQEEEDESDEFKISEDEDSEATEVEEEGEVESTDSGDWKPQKTWYNSRASTHRPSRAAKNFVVDDDEYESDENATKRRSTRNSNRGHIVYNDWESNEDQTDEEESNFSDCSSNQSIFKPKRKSASNKKATAPSKKKSKPKNGDHSDSSIARKRKLLRKLVKKRRRDMSESLDSEDEGNSEKKKHDSDGSEFVPDDEGSDESPKFKKKNVLRSSDEEEEEDTKTENTDSKSQPALQSTEQAEVHQPQVTKVVQETVLAKVGPEPIVSTAKAMQEGMLTTAKIVLTPIDKHFEAMKASMIEKAEKVVQAKGKKAAPKNPKTPKGKKRGKKGCPDESLSASAPGTGVDVALAPGTGVDVALASGTGENVVQKPVAESADISPEKIPEALPKGMAEKRKKVPNFLDVPSGGEESDDQRLDRRTGADVQDSKSELPAYTGQHQAPANYKTMPYPPGQLAQQMNYPFPHPMHGMPPFSQSSMGSPPGPMSTMSDGSHVGPAAPHYTSAVRPGQQMLNNLRPVHPGYPGHYGLGPNQHRFQHGGNQGYPTMEMGQGHPNMNQAHQKLAEPVPNNGNLPPPGAHGHVQKHMGMRPPFHMGQQHNEMNNFNPGYGANRMPGMQHHYYDPQGPASQGPPQGMAMHYPGHYQSSPLNSMGQMTKNLGQAPPLQSPPHAPSESAREKASMVSPPAPETLVKQEKFCENLPDTPAILPGKDSKKKGSSAKKSKTKGPQANMSPPTAVGSNKPSKLPSEEQSKPPDPGDKLSKDPAGLGPYRPPKDMYNPPPNMPLYQMPYMQGQQPNMHHPQMAHTQAPFMSQNSHMPSQCLPPALNQDAAHSEKKASATEGADMSKMAGDLRKGGQYPNSQVSQGLPPGEQGHPVQASHDPYSQRGPLHLHGPNQPGAYYPEHYYQAYGAPAHHMWPQRMPHCGPSLPNVYGHNSEPKQEPRMVPDAKALPTEAGKVVHPAMSEQEAGKACKSESQGSAKQTAGPKKETLMQDIKKEHTESKHHESVEPTAECSAARPPGAPATTSQPCVQQPPAAKYATADSALQSGVVTTQPQAHPGVNMGQAWADVAHHYPHPQSMNHWPSMTDPNQYNMMYAHSNMVTNPHYQNQPGRGMTHNPMDERVRHSGPYPSPQYPGYESSYPGNMANPRLGGYPTEMSSSFKAHEMKDPAQFTKPSPASNPGEQFSESASKPKRPKTIKKCAKDNVLVARGRGSKGRGRGRGGFMIDNLLEARGEEDGEDSGEMKDIVSYVATDDYFKQQTSS
ncbi:uncharacterized protein LOC131956927 isoform X2 [Physella acuta]|uniref:uncharacterized protein LOC131956927 isoform X2 n=1 Tax=Physella acuta TaxID=109671 RepID=UPI0027DC5E84|nr:uncharacterized protein LOC131956927 isoform X2 [Physella acuta]